jgi:hypothetical protein
VPRDLTLSNNISDRGITDLLLLIVFQNKKRKLSSMLSSKLTSQLICCSFSGKYTQTLIQFSDQHGLLKYYNGIYGFRMDEKLDSRCRKCKSHVLQQVIKSVTILEGFQMKLADTPLSKTHENLFQNKHH